MVFLANQPIQYAESSDGTRVAYRRFGSGTPVVFVGGALSTAEAAGPLAAAFAEAGLQGVTYDRRGRGCSGDTAPYVPEREAEDRAPLSTRWTVPRWSSDTPRVRCCRYSRRPRAYR
jgi:alpha-beta hydrolase superfamily lysophospholipase